MNILRFVIPKSLVTYLTADNTVRQALEKMSFHRYTAMSVLDNDGMYIGTLRNDEIFDYFRERGRVDYRDAERDSVVTILNRDYTKPLLHSASMTELVEKVKEHNFVPVVDDRGCFVGIILRRDVLNYLLKYYDENDRGKS